MKWVILGIWIVLLLILVVGGVVKSWRCGAEEDEQ